MVIVNLDEWSASKNGKQIGKRKSNRICRNKRLENRSCEDFDDTYNDIFIEIANNFNLGSFLKQTKDNFHDYIEKFKCQTQPLLNFFNARRVYCQYCQRLADRDNLINGIPIKLTVNSRFNDCFVEKNSSKDNTMEGDKSHTSFSCDRCRQQYILKRKEVKYPTCSKCNRYCDSGKEFYSWDTVPPSNPKQCTCQSSKQADDEIWNMQFKRWWGWNVGRRRNRCAKNGKDCCWPATPPPVRQRMAPWDVYDIREERQKSNKQCEKRTYYTEPDEPRRRSVSCFSCCFGPPRRVYYQPCYYPPEQFGRRNTQNADKHLYQSWLRDASSNSSNSLNNNNNKVDMHQEPRRPKQSSIEYLSCRIESVTQNLDGGNECCCCCPCRTEYKSACCQTSTIQKQINQAAQTQRQCCRCCRKHCNKCKPHCTLSSKVITPQTKRIERPVKQTSGSPLNVNQALNEKNFDDAKKQPTISTDATIHKKCVDSSTVYKTPKFVNIETETNHEQGACIETMVNYNTNQLNGHPAGNPSHTSVKLTRSKTADGVGRGNLCNCRNDVNNLYFSHIKTSPLFLDPMFSSPLTGRKYTISPKIKKAIKKHAITKSKYVNELDYMYPPFLDISIDPEKAFNLQKPKTDQHSIDFLDLQLGENKQRLINSKDLSRINLPEFLHTNSLLSKCELHDLDQIINNLLRSVEEERKYNPLDLVSNCNDATNAALIEASKLVSDIIENSNKMQTKHEGPEIATEKLKSPVIQNEFEGFTAGDAPCIPPPPDFATPNRKKSHETLIQFDINYTIETLEDPVNFNSLPNTRDQDAPNNATTTNSLMAGLCTDTGDVNCSRIDVNYKINDAMTSTNVIELQSTGTSTEDLTSCTTFLNELDGPSSEASDDLKPLPKIYKSRRSFADLFRRKRSKVFKDTKTAGEASEANCCISSRKKLN